jgi:hypothetical protein
MSRVIYVCASTYGPQVTYLVDELGGAEPMRTRGLSAASAAELGGGMPGDASALVALLDPAWLQATSAAAAAARRDALGELLAWAGQTGVPVFPLLLPGATMPDRQQLPADLAYLAALQARPLDGQSWVAWDANMVRIVIQVLAQLGLLPLRLTLVWVGLVLAIGAISGVFALVLFPPPWSLAVTICALVATAGLAIGLGGVLVRTVRSPMGPYYSRQFLIALFVCVLVALGGAALFATSALGPALRAEQDLPLAILGTVLLVLGLAAQGLFSVAILVASHSGQLVTTPKTQDAAQPQPHDVFISYRRRDSQEICDRIVSYLATRSYQAFRDVSSILVGADFDTVLRQAIDGSAAMLVLIGPEWLTLRDAEGRRRIDDPEDYVHREIARALAAHKQVIPVVVNGARMPAEAEIPPDLRGIAWEPSFTVRGGRHFDSEMRAVRRHLLGARRRAFRRNPRARVVLSCALAAAAAAASALLVSALPEGTLVPAGAAASVATSITWVLGAGAAACTLTSSAFACIEAITTRRWRLLLSLTLWTAAGLAAYLIVVAQPSAIPIRFQLASEIAAALVYLCLLGNLCALSFDLRLQIARTRAQPTLPAL